MSEPAVYVNGHKREVKSIELIGLSSHSHNVGSALPFIVDKDGIPEQFYTTENIHSIP